MTNTEQIPNPDGDVIERTINAISRVLQVLDSHATVPHEFSDYDKECRAELSSVLAGLLKLSEGSCDERLAGYRDGLKDGAAAEEIFGSCDGRLREALGECFCPRPANGDPDYLEIRECVKLGHCGCKMGAVFSSATPSPIDAALRAALKNAAIESDPEKGTTVLLSLPSIEAAQRLHDALVPYFPAPDFSEVSERALPTPAREIDRERLNDWFNRLPSDPGKTEWDELISIIGGRHV